MSSTSPIMWLCLLLCGSGILLLRRSWCKAAEEKVLQRLQQDMPGNTASMRQVGGLRRRLLRAGIDLSKGQLQMLLLLVVVLTAFILLFLGVRTLLLIMLLSVIGLYGLLRWRYQRRVESMISLLPELLDHVVRSLRSGRSLGDAMELAIDRTRQPLRGALSVCQHGMRLGLPLTDVFEDFALLYDRRELQMLATAIKVNQRYGGNVSHLMENLIGMIRDQERATSQLRAMTGESRVGAWVLGSMPLLIGGYIFMANPEFFLGLWHHDTGRTLLYSAILLQILGTTLLWRMMRSIR